MSSGPAISPRDGDVVIARDPHDPSLYTLTVVPGTPQVRYPRLDDALAVAIDWAAKMPVTVWMTEDGCTFAPVEAAQRRNA